ncbi:MAG TPA: fluoride efflux transporter CrcB [Pseudonocardiaceae bacterium]|nr:fluoride efflux transporter CrcB [Pseudonocardiaceae bacterium]
MDDPLGADAHPIDSDVDVHVSAQRTELARSHGRILVVVALGGGIGALARYGIGLLLPTTPGHFPFGTLLINVLGCGLIGVLMVLVTEVYSSNPLLRPFFGTGILGGFTTFSTYTNEFRALLRPGTVPLALAYLAGTLICALLAVSLATWLTRRLTRKPAPEKELVAS